ncbi:MAG: S8 family serine peptidase [Calothrix sp. SM1_5_4]|nr:S8 family serine peptidase [Calothrix sp. SM1_5_4]
MKISHLYRLIIVTSVTVALTACGSSENSAPQQESLSSASLVDGLEIIGPKVQIDADVLADQGTPAVEADVSDAAGNFKAQNKRSLRLARGSRLAALIDNECLNRNASGMASDIAGLVPERRDLKHQAYSFELDQETDLEVLSRSAEADDCVLQVGNDIEMQAIAVPNDSSYSKQWQHTAMESAAGWDVFFGATGGISQDVIIAIIDTGVNYNHADLKNNIWKDSQGRPGRDFVNKDDDPIDDHGHGTHCAGLAGAVGNNSIGVAGTMMARVKIMSIKGLNSSGSGSTSTLVNGINYAIDNGANVISLSLGGKGTSSLWKTALSNAVSKGVVVVAAAGNNGSQLTSSNWYSPASYARDLKGMMAIGSITSSLSRSSFSNYGPEFVEVGAPGSSVLSTVSSGGYGTMSGTSMATPIAAGAAGLTIGLLKSRGISPTPALVEQLIVEGSAKDSKLTSAFKDGNRINLKNARRLDQL